MTGFDTTAKSAETAKGAAARPEPGIMPGRERRAARTAAAPAVRGRRPLGLWRLEVLRVTRTRRWLLLLLAFPLLGILGPIVVRHLHRILDVLGADGGALPETVEAQDAMIAYTGVGGQIGLLVALGVMAAALALDHRPGLAAFYRTRTCRPRDLVIPRWTVCAAAVCLANLLATGIVWAEIRWLFGPVPADRMIYGMLFETVYLLMALSLVAGAAAFLRRPVALFGAALIAMVLSPLPRLWKPLRAWEPSELGGAGIQLLGESTPGDFVRPAIVALLLTAVMLSLAVWRIGRREM
ncbi:hypothetical protein [Yinghuangia soli]|uniref:ABC-2 type transport system permease protein n=1 Tax=Yinghuangia soli TaxID=2908204 RepID=A0AA41Q3H2_9ACTN|nr:hypothetical protein [Yinghuangia soli]MCF2529422.1 hypothetical protein [Yinghuangia soli]